MISILKKLILGITIVSSFSFCRGSTNQTSYRFRTTAKNTAKAGIIASMPFLLFIDIRKYEDWRAGILVASLVGSLLPSLIVDITQKSERRLPRYKRTIISKIDPDHFVFHFVCACLFALLVWSVIPKLPPPKRTPRRSSGVLEGIGFSDLAKLFLALL